MTQLATRDESEEQVALARVDFSLEETGHALTQAVKLAKMVETQFREGHHYMHIPGTAKDQRPHLKDPGAGLVMAGYRVRTGDYKTLESRLDEESGHYQIALQSELIHFNSGRVVSTGVGASSSHEVKYAYRWVQLADVPSGLDRTILPTRTRRDGAKQYRVDNPDIGDLYNNLWKMAAKRAEGDAVLKLPGCSELFAGYIVSKPGKGEDDEPDRTYWCEEHKTYWTQMANGRYAHKIEGTKQMCGRPLPQKATTAEQIAKDIDDLYGPQAKPAPAPIMPKKATQQVASATKGPSTDPSQSQQVSEVSRAEFLRDIKILMAELNWPHKTLEEWVKATLPGIGMYITPSTLDIANIQEKSQLKALHHALYEAFQKKSAESPGVPTSRDNEEV